jgi:adenylate cyclase
MQTEKLSDDSASRYVVKTKAGGFSVEWEERPFEWVYRRSFRVRRRMRSGPVSEVESLFLFKPEELGGVTVTLRLEIHPKFGIMRPLVKLGANKQIATLEAAVKRVDAAIQAGLPPPGPIGAVSAEALERARTALRLTCPAELADKLCDHIATGSEEHVSRIRPFELADAWGADRRAVLATCLRAVRAGLLELRWEVVCPSCRVAADTKPTLSGLSDHGACHMCEIDFGLELDEAVEATFKPTPAVRKVDEALYCMGGPSRTPHVVAQAILPPRGEALLEAPLEPGRYRLFVRGGANVAIELTPEGMEDLWVEANAPPAFAQVRPGGRIRVHSVNDAERHVKLERTVFPQLAATAREVTAIPGFRRDFSSEVLRPDLSLKVSKVALFFSDLTASTQLYSNVGDAAALRLVQDHFDVVVKLLEQHGGTLVKTIGDAVMAVFADELDGLKAAMAVLAAFEPFRKGSALRMTTHIKLGLYAGPSYLVTANNVLDYFGQTVNIAARLQAQAESGELVVEAALADYAIKAGKLPADAVKARYQATLKGVDGPISVVRLVTTSSAPRSQPEAPPG